MANNNYILSPDQMSAENIFLSIGQKEILKGATIQAAKGSITGLLGRNGSGKSTMLQCVFGTLRAASCDVFVNGIRIATPYTTHRLLNYLPQIPFLPHSLSVKKVMQQYNVDKTEAFSYFPEIADEADKRIHELSGGMERLVSVLVILLADTRFSLLDEPFAHIMPLHVERLQSLLLQQKRRKGIIITDHLYQQLLSVSDTLYLMKEGQTVFIHTTEDLALHGYIRP